MFTKIKISGTLLVGGESMRIKKEFVQKFYNDIEKSIELERIEFINKAISKHLKTPRTKSKSALKRLRAERTRLKKKWEVIW